MNALRIGVGSAVLALLTGGALSHLSHANRDGLVQAARAALGGEASASERRPARPEPPAVAKAGPAPLPALASGDAVIAPDRRGQYETTVEIEGQTLPVLVDTGATFVALSFEDADRIGVRPLPADFRLPLSTANGRTYAAPVRLAAVRLGGIVVRDVPAIVASRGQMSQTLLGMSFLSRLGTMRIEDGSLVLAQ